jgi:hypothetical protein
MITRYSPNPLTSSYPPTLTLKIINLKIREKKDKAKRAKEEA